VQPCSEDEEKDEEFFFIFPSNGASVMKLTGENRSTRGKPCPTLILSTTNPTWNDPGSNPGFRGERPGTNRLNHGTAFRAFGNYSANLRFPFYQTRRLMKVYNKFL
jgi:hypothetical protein